MKRMVVSFLIIFCVFLLFLIAKRSDALGSFRFCLLGLVCSPTFYFEGSDQGAYKPIGNNTYCSGGECITKWIKQSVLPPGAHGFCAGGICLSSFNQKADIPPPTGENYYGQWQRGERWASDAASHRLRQYYSTLYYIENELGGKTYAQQRSYLHQATGFYTFYDFLNTEQQKIIKEFPQFAGSTALDIGAGFNNDLFVDVLPPCSPKPGANGSPEFGTIGTGESPGVEEFWPVYACTGEAKRCYDVLPDCKYDGRDSYFFWEKDVLQADAERDLQRDDFPPSKWYLRYTFRDGHTENNMNVRTCRHWRKVEVGDDLLPVPLKVREVKCEQGVVDVQKSSLDEEVKSIDPRKQGLFGERIGEGTILIPNRSFVSSQCTPCTPGCVKKPQQGSCESRIDCPPGDTSEKCRKGTLIPCPECDPNLVPCEQTGSCSEFKNKPVTSGPYANKQLICGDGGTNGRVNDAMCIFAGSQLKVNGGVLQPLYDPNTKKQYIKAKGKEYTYDEMEKKIQGKNDMQIQGMIEQETGATIRSDIDFSGG